MTNDLLADDFRALGAQDVEVFPGPAPRVGPKPASRGARTGLVWVGSPSTYESVRTEVYPALDLLTDRAMSLAVVGAAVNRTAGRVREMVWSPEAENSELEAALVGLAPQVDSEWSRRKAFYKVFEYLAHDVIPVVPRLPAVQTLLGEDLDLIASVVDGHSPADWARAIDVAIRRVVDEAWIGARDRVFERWSAPRLATTVLEACRLPNAPS